MTNRKHHEIVPSVISSLPVLVTLSSMAAIEIGHRISAVLKRKGAKNDS